ncbi:MAG TPA: hypothetical protein VJP77_08305 [Planctomycetota bacterium]|nr:hypothetical protein [Planctomycetota bacterium]
MILDALPLALVAPLLGSLPLARAAQEPAPTTRGAVLGDLVADAVSGCAEQPLESIRRQPSRSTTDEAVVIPLQDSGIATRAIVPGLLGPATRVDPPRPSAIRYMPLFNWVGFTAWSDGEDALVAGNIYGLWRLDASGSELASRKLPYAEQFVGGSRGFDVCELHAFPDGPGGVRALVGGGEFVQTDLVALGAEDEVLWSFVPEDGSALQFAPLYSRDGPTGVIVAYGDDPVLLELDLAGKPLSRRVARSTVAQLHTHPDLPGFVLEVGPQSFLRKLGEGDRHLVRRLETDDVFELSGALFRGADGRPAVLVHDGGGGDESLVLRLGDDGKERWRVAVPTGVRDVTVVATRAGPLPVVVLADLRLLVLDDAGRLLSESALPLPEGRDRSYAVRSVEAGHFADGSTAIAAYGQNDLWILPVDEERLAGAAPAHEDR